MEHLGGAQLLILIRIMNEEHLERGEGFNKMQDQYFVAYISSACMCDFRCGGERTKLARIHFPRVF